MASMWGSLLAKKITKARLTFTKKHPDDPRLILWTEETKQNFWEGVYI